jgi:hypothetical protein
MKTTASKQKQITLTPQEFRRLQSLGYKAIPATLNQTLGPNCRHIFFVSHDGSHKKRSRVHYYDVPMTPNALYELAKGV